MNKFKMLVAILITLPLYGAEFSSVTSPAYPVPALPAIKIKGDHILLEGIQINLQQMLSLGKKRKVSLLDVFAADGILGLWQGFKYNQIYNQFEICGGHLITLNHEPQNISFYFLLKNNVVGNHLVKIFDPYNASAIAGQVSQIISEHSCITDPVRLDKIRIMCLMFSMFNKNPLEKFIPSLKLSEQTAVQPYDKAYPNALGQAGVKESKVTSDSKKYSSTKTQVLKAEPLSPPAVVSETSAAAIIECTHENPPSVAPSSSENLVTFATVVKTEPEANPVLLTHPAVADDITTYATVPAVALVALKEAVSPAHEKSTSSTNQADTLLLKDEEWIQPDHSTTEVDYLGKNLVSIKLAAEDTADTIISTEDTIASRPSLETLTKSSTIQLQSKKSKNKKKSKHSSTASTHDPATTKEEWDLVDKVAQENDRLRDEIRKKVEMWWGITGYPVHKRQCTHHSQLTEDERKWIIHIYNELTTPIKRDSYFIHFPNDKKMQATYSFQLQSVWKDINQFLKIPDEEQMEFMRAYQNYQSK